MPSGGVAYTHRYVFRALLSLAVNRSGERGMQATTDCHQVLFACVSVSEIL